MLRLVHLFGDRGLYPGTLVLGHLFGKSNFAIVRIFGDQRIKVFLSDRYWIPPILAARGYEPEVAMALSSVLRENSCFVDCGANIGWWSIFASTRIKVPRRILAIEASPSVFAQLDENARLNGNAFGTLNAAVWNRTGDELTILTHELHAASSVKSDRSAFRGRDSRLERTTSVTLHDAINEHVEIDDGRCDLIVKLDVEGAEIEALEGLGPLLTAISLLVYEDHGSDPTCRVTRAIMRKGFSVFRNHGPGGFREIRTIEEVRDMKRDPRRGYNLFACWPGHPSSQVLKRVRPASPRQN
jgi:FkbM family methyltransferase